MNWQGSSFCMFCHYGTHVDAPNCFVCDGIAVDQVPLNRIIGPAAVIELADFDSEGKITGNVLEERGRAAAGATTIWVEDIFWRRGPYLTGDPGDWLVERGVKTIVYEFADEFVVRNHGFRGEQCINHHKILGNSIFNIEYVVNLAKIERPRCAIIALSLKFEGPDGAPARAIAWTA